MMPFINGVTLAVSSSLAGSIVAKVTVTTALGLFGARLARKNRAAHRHALLAAAFGVLLVLPIVSIVAPPVSIAMPAAAQDRIATAAAAVPHVASAHAEIAATSAVPRSAGLSLSALLFAGWIAGAVLFLLPAVTGLWQVRSLRRSALPWRHGHLVLQKLAPDAGIHRRVEVLIHEALPGPMTCGVLHPAIVLPRDAQTWEGEELDRALIHELEHVRRGDWISQCLARAVCAVYWFHPLVWIAWRQLALAAERACDDAVLSHSEPTAYADQLVGLAMRLSLTTKGPFLAMANRGDLATRVGAVLDSRQQRGRAGTRCVALACAAAAAVVLAISPLRMVAAPQSASTVDKSSAMLQFSANSSLVIVNVTVSDPNGKSIEGLGPNDFDLTEDGMAQTISVFEFQKLAAALQGPRDSISSYYLLGYYTRNQDPDGRFRKIQVVRKRETQATLHYRPGYYPSKSSNATASGGAGNGIGLDPTIPLLLYKKEPEYPEEARGAKYQGTVLLSVEIDGGGQVANIKVIRSAGLGLDEKAIEAVQQWKFRPGIKDGRPVTVQARVDVNFRLL